MLGADTSGIRSAGAMIRDVITVILSLAFLAPNSQSQTKVDSANPPQTTAPKSLNRETIETADMDHARDRLEHEMMSRVVADRQESLRRDSDRLAALAAELKQNVDKTNANILSMDVIKKAQEIQKLAKSVQDKMKNAF